MKLPRLENRYAEASPWRKLDIALPLAKLTQYIAIHNIKHVKLGIGGLTDRASVHRA